MRETSASKPLLTHRKRIRRRQNRRRASLPGTAWKIAYLLSMRRPVCRRRDSHAGFRTELENLIGDVKRKGTSGSNREAESIDAPIRVGLLHSSDEAGVMLVERREQAIGFDAGQPATGGTRWSKEGGSLRTDGTSRISRET